MSHDEGNTFRSKLDLLDFEELVGSLLSGDSVNGESTLDVVEQTEVLSGLLNGDDICSKFDLAFARPSSPSKEMLRTHETSGVSLVGSHFVVDGHETLLDDKGDFTTGESVFKSVAEEDLRGFASVICISLYRICLLYHLSTYPPTAT